MGILVLIGMIPIISQVLIRLDNGAGPPKVAPAELGFIGGVGYYASHPRLLDWFWGYLFLYIETATLEHIERREWPNITWKKCIFTPLVFWVFALGMTRFDAFWHRE